MVDHPVHPAGSVICPTCGYNLHGLAPGAPCPECGKAAPLNRIDGDAMCHAPPSYLRLLAVGGVLLALGAAGLVMSVVVAIVKTSVLYAPAALGIFGILWWLGVIVVTRPRKFTRIPRFNPRLELIWSRRLSVLTQWGPIVAGALVAVSFQASVKWLLIVAAAAGLVWLIGLFPLSRWLTELAHWGRDVDLASRISIFPFGLVVGLVLISALPIASRPSSVIGFLSIPVVVMGIVVVIVFAGIFVYSMIGLMRLGVWSVSNAHAVIESGHVAAERERDFFGREALPPVSSIQTDDPRMEGTPTNAPRPAVGNMPVLERREGVKPYALAPEDQEPRHTPRSAGN